MSLPVRTDGRVFPSDVTQTLDPNPGTTDSRVRNGRRRRGRGPKLLRPASGRGTVASDSCRTDTVEPRSPPRGLYLLSSGLRGGGEERGDVYEGPAMGRPTVRPHQSLARED